MRYLLDTHTLLWFLQDEPQLPEKVGAEITNIDNSCYVSIASLMEIAIKINLGKLTIKFPFVKLVENLTIITKDGNFPSYTDKILWK